MMDNPHWHQAMGCHQTFPSKNNPSSACIPSTNRRQWFRTSTLLQTHIPGAVTTCHHCTIRKPKIWQISYGENLFSMIGLEINYVAERMDIIWNFTASLWSPTTAETEHPTQKSPQKQPKYKKLKMNSNFKASLEFTMKGALCIYIEQEPCNTQSFLQIFKTPFQL